MEPAGALGPAVIAGDAAEQVVAGDHLLDEALPQHADEAARGVAHHVAVGAGAGAGTALDAAQQRPALRRGEEAVEREVAGLQHGRRRHRSLPLASRSSPVAAPAAGSGLACPAGAHPAEMDTSPASGPGGDRLVDGLGSRVSAKGGRASPGGVRHPLSRRRRHSRPQSRAGRHGPSSRRRRRRHLGAPRPYLQRPGRRDRTLDHRRAPQTSLPRATCRVPVPMGPGGPGRMPRTGGADGPGGAPGRRSGAARATRPWPPCATYAA